MSLIQEALEKAHPSKSKPLMQHPEKIEVPKVDFKEQKDPHPQMSSPQEVGLSSPNDLIGDLSRSPIKGVRGRQKTSIPAFAGMTRTTIPAGAYIVLILLAAVIWIGNLLFQSKTDKVPASSLNQPTTSGPAFGTKYTLNGITFSEGLRVALIDNRIVRVGDHIKGNATVKEIADRSVTLHVQGKDLQLNL